MKTVNTWQKPSKYPVIDIAVGGGGGGGSGRSRGGAFGVGVVGGRGHQEALGGAVLDVAAEPAAARESEMEFPSIIARVSPHSFIVNDVSVGHSLMSSCGCSMVFRSFFSFSA